MIDKRFLEFWGNTFLSAARGQAQMEELSKWFHRSFPSTDALPDFFLRAYGLKAGKAESASDRDAESEKIALEDFNKAYANWLRLMGAVPLEDHRRLTEKYESLRKENEEQAAMIRYLSGVVSGDSDIQSAALDALKNLTEKQTEEFSVLVRAFGEYVRGQLPSGPDSDGSDTESGAKA